MKIRPRDVPALLGVGVHETGGQTADVLSTRGQTVIVNLPVRPTTSAEGGAEDRFEDSDTHSVCYRVSIII